MTSSNLQYLLSIPTADSKGVGMLLECNATPTVVGAAAALRTCKVRYERSSAATRRSQSQEGGVDASAPQE